MVTAANSINEQVLAKLGQLAQRFEQLQQQMNDPAVARDSARIRTIAKEHGLLKEIVAYHYQYHDIDKHFKDAQTILADTAADAELRQMAQEEVDQLQSKLTDTLEKAKEALVMSDDAVIDAVIVEIRAGTGGEEAALFAGDLHGMYTRYADRRKWKVEPISFSPTDRGGFREVIFAVKGKGVWQALGYEGGGHRVQRVPQTEAQGRIHTSAATVAILPEPQELDIEIRPDDVVEHVARASGPGGQNVNKVSSAIRLEHIPTGITVSMQDDKSQHKNRAKAWRILRSRVFDFYEQQRRAERDSTRKNMIGSGDRSQRIRTYNFPQNRMTDHRINLSLYNLDKIIMGEMDDLIKALIDYDKQQRLENISVI